MTKQTDDDSQGWLAFEVVEDEIQSGKKVPTRGVYLLPNLVTTLSLLSAFFSLVASASGQFYQGAFAIFFSAVLDGMDGRVARMLNAQSPFGEQFDSLADMIAFGMAPALLLYQFALAPLGRIGVACAFVYVACAAFRLARFNVQIHVVDKQYFVGLASPLAAILVTCAVLVSLDHGRLPSAFYAGFIVISGLLMASNVRYHSFKVFDRKRVPFAVLIAVVLALGAVLYDIPVGIFAIGVLYALSGFWTSLRKG